MTDIIVSATGLSKEYIRGQFRVPALENVDLEVYRGEFVAFMGPSGSGKSTLLHILAGLDRPGSGQIRLLGQDLTTLGADRLSIWRNIHIGFVFQSFNLVPVLTALENVELPLKLTRLKKRERLEHAETALSLVGLGDRLDHYPRQLSGGQEQRVAIARAIVTDPDLILAHQPTGNLDAASARDVLTLLQKLNPDSGKTIILVTHDPHSAAAAGRVTHPDNGTFAEAA